MARKASEEPDAAPLDTPDFWAGVQGGKDVKISIGQVLSVIRSKLTSTTAQFVAKAQGYFIDPATFFDALVFGGATITATGTYILDMSATLNTRLAVTGDLTLGTPTSIKSGQAGDILIYRTNAGSITFGGSWLPVGKKVVVAGAVGETYLVSYKAINSTTLVYTCSRLDASDNPVVPLAVASKVEIFDANGTWTKDPAAKRILTYVMGGQGGGESGARRASGAGSLGGGGGGGANIMVSEFNAADVPSTVPVVVGARGLGGASVTTDNTVNNPGTKGGDSSFGTPGTTVDIRVSGTLGGGTTWNGTSVDVTPGAGGNGMTNTLFYCTYPSGSGSSAASITSTSILYGSNPITYGQAPAPGASGAGINKDISKGTADGGANGVSLTYTIVGDAVYATAGIGSSKRNAVRTPLSSRALYGMLGNGGAGGWTNADGTAGDGAGVPVGEFGGGGGGGGSLNGNPSGKGGNGGAGRVVVVTCY